MNLITTPHSNSFTSPEADGSLFYDDFIQALIRLHPQGVVEIIHQVLKPLSTMKITEKIQQVDKLKGCAAISKKAWKRQNPLCRGGFKHQSSNLNVQPPN